MCSKSVYETRPGDTPAIIAKEQLGDAGRWREVVEWNAEKCGFMGPHDWYRVGTFLRLPEVAAMSAIDTLEKIVRVNKKRGIENDNYRSSFFESLLKEVEALRQERDGLRADAARYRWLRSNNVGPSQIEKVSDDCNPPYFTLKCESELDTAIDAAMAKEQG